MYCILLGRFVLHLIGLPYITFRWVVSYCILLGCHVLHFVGLPCITYYWVVSYFISLVCYVSHFVGLFFIAFCWVVLYCMICITHHPTSSAELSALGKLPDCIECCNQGLGAFLKLGRDGSMHMVFAIIWTRHCQRGATQVHWWFMLSNVWKGTCVKWHIYGLG